MEEIAFMHLTFLILESAAAAVVRCSSQLSAASDEHLVRPADGLHAVSDAVQTARVLAGLHRSAARHLSRLHYRTKHASIDDTPTVSVPYFQPGVIMSLSRITT